MTNELSWENTSANHSQMYVNYNYQVNFALLDATFFHISLLFSKELLMSTPALFNSNSLYIRIYIRTYHT